MKNLFIALAFACLAAGCASQKVAKEVRFLSWNIGHFSRGTSNESTVSPAQALDLAQRYLVFFNQADIIGLSEYSETFVSNGTRRTSAVLFKDYTKTIGPSMGKMQNAMMTRSYPVLEHRTRFFTKNCDNAYYLAVKLDIDGTPVWFVQTHLDSRIYIQGHFKDREYQMRELLWDFKDEPNVVLSGTFNVGIRIPGSRCFPAPEEYDIFKRAGYELANVNGTGTYPTDDPVQPVDNVIVKGVRLADVHFVSPGDLSDHFALDCRLVLK